jgi:hypothetical protein
MDPIKIENITADTLDEVAREWEENRIEQVVRNNFIKLGDEYRQQRYEFSVLEAKVKIRAMRLYHYHKLSKAEIAEMLGIEVKEVRRWLK